MGKSEHVVNLEQGVEFWNYWRKSNPEIEPVLTGANLFRANLEGVDFSNTNLRGANLEASKLVKANLHNAELHSTLLMRSALHGANLQHANCVQANFEGAVLKGACLHQANFERAKLKGARFTFAKMKATKFTNANLVDTDFSGIDSENVDFQGAKLRNANFQKAILKKANLRSADLIGANLREANMKNASLIDANLRNASFVKTIIKGANFDSCRIYGISAWDLIGEPSSEKNLIINPSKNPHVQVDNLEVAQFVYLLLANKKLREVIDTISSKVILILGRFTSERKIVLDRLRDELRNKGFVPIIFDFSRPRNKDFTETIMTLAGLSLFVIADITNPKSSPLELQAVVPDYQIPFVPIIQSGEEPFSMFVNLQAKYDWVLTTIAYRSIDELVDVLDEAIIERALEKHIQLRQKKAQAMPILKVEDFR